MKVVTDYVPRGFIGIIIAGFLAAFMSTVATQLNWGASYLIADFYRRFLKKDGTEKHYVNASRIASVILDSKVSPFTGSDPVLFAKSALTTTFVTTVVWIVATLVTRAEPEDVLVRFYRHVHPDVRGWK